MIALVLGLFFGWVLLRAGEGLSLGAGILILLWFAFALLEAAITALRYVGSLIALIGITLAGVWVVGFVLFFMLGCYVKLVLKFEDVSIIQPSLRWPGRIWTELLVPSLRRVARKRDDIIRRVWDW